MILDALKRATDGVVSSDLPKTYATVLGGPIFEDSHVDKLRNALRVFITPGQCFGFLVQTKGMLERAANSEPSSQQSIPDTESTKRPCKRRKLDFKHTVSPAKAVDFVFVCSVITIVWPSLPIHSLADEPRSEAVTEIQGVNTNVITPLLTAGLKREHEEGGSAFRSWSWDVIMSSVLRLQYALSACTAFSIQPTHGAKAESRMFRFLELSDVLPELKIEIVNHAFFL